jgi:P-type E1-E2 ATPase
VVERIEPLPGWDDRELLGLAASADQASAHPVARALVREARSRELDLTFPVDVSETAGQGLTATVDAHRVSVGSPAFAASLGAGPPQLAATPGVVPVVVVIDGRVTGVIHVSDRIRADAVGLADRLSAVGVERVVLVTGDRLSVAESVAAAAGIDHVYAETSAAAKLELVRAVHATDPSGVAMVGDGVNDAPALALADTGIAIGTTATVATQTADAVIVSDRVDRVVDAIRISRRSMRIARQSVVTGLGLSVFGMLIAVVGLLQPVGGALAQEVIDVAVILNALRALGD